MMQNDECSSVPYRPRYSAEESSDAAFQVDERHRRCILRKKLAVTILIFATFIFAVGVFTRVYLFFADIRETGGMTSDVQARQASIKTDDGASAFWIPWKKKAITGNMAKVDSNGFFDIPDDEWEELKLETKTIIDFQHFAGVETSYLLSESGANVDSNLWWFDNWKPNFTCQNKVNIGGKWICDPSRIIKLADAEIERVRRNKSRRKKKRCIIYISGGNEIDFAQNFLDFSLARMIDIHFVDGGQVGSRNDFVACEVHVFTPNRQEAPDARDGLFFHPWGFRPSIKESMGLATDNTTSIAFKTLDETISELGHSGRISILAIDCQSCEWDLYRDILSLKKPIQQVLLQMHGTPFMANELFLAMQEAGYVIFQRKAAQSGGGEVYDYSWLNLSPSFFNWKVE